MSRLANKATLITGGTTGIGFATAQRFLQEGARVAITGNDPERLEQARQALGAGVVALRADAADVTGQQDIAAAVKQAFGSLDAVFVNAGIAKFQPLEAWTAEDFDRSLAVNLKGPFFLVQALLPILNNPASIVLNGSINAHLGKPASSVYAASKAGLISLARTLSGELAARGVRVNVVSPGPVETPIYGKLGLAPADTQALAAALKQEIPAGRFGTPEEIANAVVFLASDEARYTVGAELILDGGMTVS